MRFPWDNSKNELLKANSKRGGIGFETVLQVFSGRHYVALRNDDPEQFFAIGWVGLKLYTVIFEIREDEPSEFYHLVTFWKSTTFERKIYAENSK